MSVWGTGDSLTLAVLEKEKIHGKWLNLAAGDGRYNLPLLEKADFVLAVDKDKAALRNLHKSTPAPLRTKLNVKALDITGKLPFSDGVFDGIFCTGTLHLFPIEKLNKIGCEIKRVLKEGGTIIIDFATDIKRVKPNGKPYYYASEPKYTLHEGELALKGVFKYYHYKIYKSFVKPEEISLENVKYTFSCNFLLLVAKK